MMAQSAQGEKQISNLRMSFEQSTLPLPNGFLVAFPHNFMLHEVMSKGHISSP